MSYSINHLTNFAMKYFKMNSRDPLHFPDKRFIEELVFSASRSGGPGGQNVNKVNTKVELRFNVNDSLLMSAEEKKSLYKELGNKINSRGELVLFSEKYRSQLKNKQQVIEKFFDLIIAALTPPKKRIPVKPTAASKEKRLERKKVLSKKKETRKKPEIE